MPRSLFRRIIPCLSPLALVACGAGFTVACTGAPPEAGRAASGDGAPQATVKVSLAPRSAGAGEQVRDAATGEMLTPPVAGAALLPTDSAHPGVRNWRAPDGRLFVDPARARASCVTKAPDGNLVVGDCAIAPARQTATPEQAP